jgi:hypothetical protein
MRYGIMETMSRTNLTQTDAVTLIEALDPDQISRRLDELVAEERALRVLLRSARARQQARRRRQGEASGSGR